MQRLAALVLLLPCLAAAAELPDALETARRFAGWGAFNLALDRVAKEQPADFTSPGWVEWERLRFDLLDRLGRKRELVERAAAMPATLPASETRALYALALRAAADRGEGSSVRHIAANLMWRNELSEETLREVRLLVIRSFVTDARGEDAFRSMLRFEQDYRPLGEAVASRFVEQLLDLGMASQAATWLAGLKETSALKLRLRVEAGLIEPAEAAKQARAFLAGSEAKTAWQVIAAAARRLNQSVLRLGALEQVLQIGNETGAVPGTSGAGALWEAYDGLAMELTAQQRLLSGDDAAWGDFAARRLESEPVVARAVFAWLARHGAAPEVRKNAVHQLAMSLQNASLERVAVRVFAERQIDISTIDPETRYLLGKLAAAGKASAAALHYWRGLPPPEGSAAQWALRIAGVALAAGRPEAAAEALRHGLSGNPVLDEDVAVHVVAAVEDIHDAGAGAHARPLLESLLPLTRGEPRRAVLTNLARMSEASGRAAVAADYYLRSALLSDAKKPDAAAAQARLAAGIALLRAGYVVDARAQFEWLLDNSKDAAQVAIAKRELARLRQ